MFHHFFLGGAVQGVEALTPQLTINSITETPVFRYKAIDATLTTWPAWGYGTTLSFVDTGADPTLNQSSAAILTGRFDKSVKMNNACFWDNGANDSLFDITTEDFVLELVVQAGPATDTTYFLSKKATTNRGWYIGWIGSTHKFRCGFQDSSDDSSGIPASAVVTDDQWYHLFIVIDRSGTTQIHVNGAISGAATDSTHISTLSVAAPLIIGALRDGGTFFCTSKISYVAGWKRNTWLDTSSQGTIALARYNALTKGQALV